jgi:thiol:disulfide interchange protein DsbD
MKPRAKSRWLIVAGLLACGSLLAAGQFGEQVLSVRVLAPQAAFAPGKTVEVALELRIAPGFHVNSDQPAEKYIVPTTVDFKPAAGLKFEAAVFPVPEMKMFSFTDKPLAVFEGTVRVTVPVTLAEDFRGSEVVIEGAVGYQACDDSSCLAPDEAKFRAVFPVMAAGASVKPATQKEKVEIGKEVAGKQAKPRDGQQAEPESRKELAEEQPEGITAAPPAKEPEAGRPAAAPPAAAPAKASVEPGSPEDLAKTVQERGLPLTFLLVFIGGLALNLTPCVYPLIPITISYFGGQAGGKKGGLVAHALFYILGMAVTYSLLGSMAAFTGGLFGAALQIPAVLLAIAAIMVALALSMFDLYEFRLPGFLNKMAGASRKGFFGTFFMGLTVGVVAAPCIGPFVLGLLTYVGDRGNVLLGFWMFFVLALGLGAPFLVLAVFSGSVNRLPRSGAWMVWVRKIFGFILLAMAVYFLRPLFSDPLLYGLTMALLLVLAGIYLAWIEPTRTEGKIFPVIRNLIGIGFFIIALLFARGGIRDSIDRRVADLASRPGGVSSPGAIQWQPYEEAGIQQAVKESRPVFIDFYADWCIPCWELDKKTFSDPRVAVLSQQFFMVKADLTSASNPLTKTLRKQYGIPGVPVLVFLGADGREKTELRAAGFIDKKEFLSRMNRALADRP